MAPLRKLNVLAPGFRRVDQRGTFVEILNDGRWESVISGEMRTGAVLGNHYHKRTRIFFYLLEGAAAVKVVHVRTGRRKRASLRAQQGIILEVNESHSIRFVKRSVFLMLKSVRYDPARPDTYMFPVEG